MEFLAVFVQPSLVKYDLWCGWLLCKELKQRLLLKRGHNVVVLLDQLKLVIDNPQVPQEVLLDVP